MPCIMPYHFLKTVLVLVWCSLYAKSKLPAEPVVCSRPIRAWYRLNSKELCKGSSVATYLSSVPCKGPYLSSCYFISFVSNGSRYSFKDIWSYIWSSCNWFLIYSSIFFAFFPLCLHSIPCTKTLGSYKEGCCSMWAQHGTYTSGNNTAAWYGSLRPPPCLLFECCEYTSISLSCQ